MKHIFLVHSSITLVMTQAVIQEERLDGKDVVLFLTRGYTTNLDYHKADVNDFFQQLENIGYQNFYLGWNTIKRIDDLLEYLMLERFIVYLPHVAHPFFQVLSTSKRCVRVNILEEGVNCLSKKMYDNRTSLKFKAINLVFNTLGIYGKRRYFRVRSNIDFPLIRREHDPVFYSITPNAFSAIQGYEKRRISLDACEWFTAENFLEDESAVFVFEGIVEQGNLSKDVFFNSIDIVVEKMVHKKIYAKFHPAQSTDNIVKICNALRRKAELTVLPSNVILEFEFLRCKELSIYGFTSSLLHYARIFGHHITSYASLWEGDPKFKRFRSSNDFPIPMNT